MRQSHTDPSLLDGEDLVGWYRRPVDQIEADRAARRANRYKAFFANQDDLGPKPSTAANTSDSAAPESSLGWTEARVAVLPAPPVAAPGGVRIGVSPAAAGAPDAAPRGGFFDTHRPIPNPALGPIYISDLPSPLNAVTPRVGNWFELGDGKLVRGVDDVERIYAEQQRRLRGEDEPEPAAQVSSADRFKDGVIPQASQIEKGQREKDATCHPNGGWERDAGFGSYAPWTRRYETQIGRAPGLDYVVRNPGAKPVKFDGCAVWDPRHQLLEAKGPGYEGLIQRAGRSWFLGSLLKGLEGQAGRQANAALGKPVEWYVAEPDAVPFFKGVTAPYPPLKVLQEAPR
ncbi:hypothetical protein [Phenylobacterium aquaticum]|uniref:hypothetical protein n=1 Tax=Phenylobacterium aquaticum TaxID=1763816 RepID=UPI0026EF81AC|nr:hypothetical protein [Phenylobacterium aquaticum]